MKLLLGSRAFRPILREWARRLATGGGGAGFSAWFMPILSDRSHRLNEACCRFAPLMRMHSWPEVKKAIPKRVRGARAFERPGAARFYETFRSSVVSRIDRYWREFAGGAVRSPGAVPRDPVKKPRLRPIEELIRKICKDDHTKGILVR